MAWNAEKSKWQVSNIQVDCMQVRRRSRRALDITGTVQCSLKRDSNGFGRKEVVLCALLPDWPQAEVVLVEEKEEVGVGVKC